MKGRCECKDGWKGVECGIADGECEVSDCNNRGVCIRGYCNCVPGYKGIHCENKDCLDTTCSGKGICYNGECLCKPGYRGLNCSFTDDRLFKYFPDCNNNGYFELELGKCTCFKGFSGDTCSIGNHSLLFPARALISRLISITI